MTLAAAIAAVVALLGCGGDSDTQREVTKVVATAQGRAVVAQVNGRPVFASCVATQAEAKSIDVQAALQECIDFELLAQEAERRGYGADPDAVEAMRREAVRALLQRDFEAGHDDPADISMEAVRPVFARPQVHVRYNHPQYRFVYYVRAAAQNQPPEVWDDAERRIRAVDADLEGKRGLTREQFWEAITAHTTDDFKFFVPPKRVNGPRTGRLEENFARAMFEIPEVGMVSEPVKTKWGWDLLLLVKIDEARRARVEEVADDIRQQMFPSWQKTEFLRWAKQLADGSGVTVEQGWESKLPKDELVVP